ncbi:MAG TPA: DUF222 domain-containing protein [Kofleriaceae bacterium]
MSGRSLLDRLLDEAGALRGIEATAADAADAALDELASMSGQASAAQGGGEQRIHRDASALRDRAAAARKAFNRADALVELAQGYLRGDRPDRSPIEVMVTIPVSVLRGELTDPVEVAELGESFLSREAARRLSCDAGVVEIIEDEQGAPLPVGRKRRTIAGALRRALHRRDRSCTYPGCTNRLFLEGHHIKHWADGGETSLLNALLVTRKRLPMARRWSGMQLVGMSTPMPRFACPIPMVRSSITFVKPPLRCITTHAGSRRLVPVFIVGARTCYLGARGAGHSLADVAKRIGASSRNAYARYEHGTSMPKLDTVQEILKAVAPELALTLGPRKGPKAAPRTAKAKRRSGRAA